MAGAFADAVAETWFGKQTGKWCDALMLFHGVVSAQTEKVVEFFVERDGAEGDEAQAGMGG
jgi:hypothetical protein